MSNKKLRIVDNHHPKFRSLMVTISALLETKGFIEGHVYTRTTLEIMNRATPIDIEGTIEWLESNGGYNDVEVMLNVFAVFT